MFTGKCCDEGRSFLSDIPDSPAAQSFSQIIQSKSESSSLPYGAVRVMIDVDGAAVERSHVFSAWVSIGG